jgi:hypothetical protein
MTNEPSFRIAVGQTDKYDRYTDKQKFRKLKKIEKSDERCDD